MNVLQMLSSAPWVERLGWTLIHFLWQGAAIAAVYAAARAVAHASRPQARYLLACAALALMMAAPLATWWMLRPANAAADAAYRIASAPAAPSADAAANAGARLPDSVRAAISAEQPARFLPWVVAVWFAGAIAFWIRLVGGWVLAARMKSALVRLPPLAWQQLARNLGARIGLGRPVRLLVSAWVQAPVVIGWLRPVVLMPVGALGGLPAEQVEALLLHELAHIRRHDFLVNILQSMSEAMLFYHPAVWWVSGHIRAEREHCCDDIAVSASGDALVYVQALARLATCRTAHFSAALAANGGSLSARIAHLLRRPGAAAEAGLGPGLLAMAALIAAAYGLFAQSGAHPAFAVASVKPSPPAIDRSRLSVGVGYRPGGRMIASNATLKLLIRFAYAPHDNGMLGHANPLLGSQVAGGPPWIDSVAYNIEAKPEGNATPEQAWQMFRTLLADRFKLALHRETRELPVYELTAAKSGLKLPAPKEVSCASFAPGTAPHAIPGKVDCGYVALLSHAAGMEMKSNRAHIADLARELSLVLDSPVLDRTGFSGEFDLDLNFAADDALVAFRGTGWPPPSPSDSGLPDIFAALQEQLGLKLVPAKGPVEVLVVDRAEKPAAN